MQNAAWFGKSAHRVYEKFTMQRQSGEQSIKTFWSLPLGIYSIDRLWKGSNSSWRCMCIYISICKCVCVYIYI